MGTYERVRNGLWKTGEVAAVAYTFNVGLRRQRQVSLWVRGQPITYAELQVSQGDMSPVF